MSSFKWEAGVYYKGRAQTRGRRLLWCSASRRWRLRRPDAAARAPHTWFITPLLPGRRTVIPPPFRVARSHTYRFDTNKIKAIQDLIHTITLCGRLKLESWTYRKKNAFSSVSFDQSSSHYRYKPTLFAYKLKKKSNSKK